MFGMRHFLASPRFWQAKASLQGGASFVDPSCHLCSAFVFVILSCLLLRKGKPLGTLVCDVFLVFCHFPIRCPGSFVILDCIES